MDLGLRLVFGDIRVDTYFEKYHFCYFINIKRFEETMEIVALALRREMRMIYAV